MAHASKPGTTRNFEIPAQFIFQPFSADWQIVSAETVEWVDEPEPRSLLSSLTDVFGNPLLRVRIYVPPVGESGMLAAGMAGLNPSCTVLMARGSIPPDVLPADENHRNTPDVARRLFQVLICHKAEFREGYWNVPSGDAIRDAGQLRDEFVNLSLDDDDDWPRSLRRFLNRWGLWESDSGFSHDSGSISLQMASPLRTILSPLPTITDLAVTRNDKPGFVLVSPYSLRKQQDNYRKAALNNNGREWLSTHTLRGFAQDVPPYFFVRRNYCRDAIEAAITIDHLESCDFGICIRHDCRRLFERTSGQRRIYCSIECAHLANVRKLRAAKKRAELKGKGAKRNAKG